MSFLPITVGGRIRGSLLRLAGFDISQGSAFSSNPRLIGEGRIQDRLRIGRDCWFNIETVMELGAEIRIGNRVTIGPQVMILTTTHNIGSFEQRCGPKQPLPVTIGDGVWIGARCTILPGTTIGPGSVIAAGALVNQDVPAHSIVAGVPARVIKQLDLTGQALAY
jgi:maltose O-acetyltransferase